MTRRERSLWTLVGILAFLLVLSLLGPAPAELTSIDYIRMAETETHE